MARSDQAGSLSADGSIFPYGTLVDACLAYHPGALEHHGSLGLAGALLWDG